MAMQINSGMSGGYGITTLPSRPELSPEAKNKAQNAVLDQQTANAASDEAQTTAARSAAVESGSSVTPDSAVTLQRQQDLALKAQQWQQAQAAKSPLEQKLASMLGDNRPQSSLSIEA